MVRCNYYNLALIYLGHPDMDGTALLSEFRVLNPEMKKIVITGLSIRGNAILCLDLGADAYLEKPVTAGLNFVELKSVKGK
ncbi:MAG: DNA-binding transcriptional regulator BasR [Methanosaeta sp. PtaU1.Bin112]|nr:MAG: DNA-binding transcriptional regulator BasR [Methanosaeta sp. PtaU1.Bin112]